MSDGIAPLPAPGPAPWPGQLTPPAELLAWLTRHHAQLLRLDAGSTRAVATLRWLVLAEADRSAPERGPPPASAKINLLKNLTLRPG